MKNITIEKLIRLVVYEVETKGIIIVDDFIKKYNITFDDYIKIKARAHYRIIRRSQLKLA